MARSNNINAGILKIAGMFGSLQMINVVCSVLRAKLVAVWIGPVGVGLFGIFNSAVDMISSIAQLGLRPSAVKEIAKASDAELPPLIKTVRRLGWVLGVAGMLLTMALSPLLSLITFGNTDWWWSFALLSATVALNASNNAEGSIFQGMKRFRRLATCTMAGVVAGTVVSVPLYYFMRTQSIVPSIIVYSLCAWVALGFYREPMPKGAAGQVSLGESLAIGKRLLTFGVYFTVSAAVNNVIIYVFISWLNTVASTDTVGLFQAGSTIVNRYAGMVFTALAMEYLPRLARYEASPKRTGLFVSNQLFLSVPCTSAMVCMLIALSGVVVHLLYDSSFMPILPYLALALAGTLLRAYSWCVAMVILARGDGRAFIVSESLSALLFLLLHMGGYLLGGFMGLGIAFALWYGAYSLIVVRIFRRYGLRLSGPVGGMMWMCGLCAGGCAAVALLASPLWALLIAVPHALWCARLVIRRIRR